MLCPFLLIAPDSFSEPVRESQMSCGVSQIIPAPVGNFLKILCRTVSFMSFPEDVGPLHKPKPFKNGSHFSEPVLKKVHA
jgi:hypothetical protein